MISITPFWRDTEFTPEEHWLIKSLGEAHKKSADRANISSVTVANAAVGSRDYGKSVAAAILTLGDLHGPIEQCYDLLANNAYLPVPEENGLVPGWGNSFIKGEPDPIWETVDERLKKSTYGNRIREITKTLHTMGKKIYPNPACYTAATALTIGMPKRIASYLFLASRLEHWTMIFLNHTDKDSRLAKGLSWA